MTCPHCNSGETGRRGRRTSLSYRTFVCRACRSLFNERTGTGFNDLQYPTDIVLMAVLWRLRYKLGFRDVAELLLQRGYEVAREPSATGSHGLRRCSPNNSGRSAAAAPAAPGTWTRHT